MVDDRNQLFVRLHLNSEGGVLNHKLKVVLARNGSGCLIQKNAVCLRGVLVVTIGSDGCEYQVVFIDGQAGV